MDRKSRIFVNVVAGLILLLATAVSHADEANHEAGSQQDLERLAAIWQKNLSEVKTAFVRYRSLHRLPSKSVGREEVLKLLEATDFVGRPDDARLLSRELALEIPPDHPAWGECELFCTANKIRENRDYEGRRLAETILIGAVQVRASRLNDQIDIHVPNGSGELIKTLDDLRIIPRLDQPAPATIEKRTAGELVVKNGGKQFVVEKVTGFVQSARAGSARSYLETFQKGRVACAGGIVFPAAVISCRYLDGVLKWIQIDVIKTANVNQPLQDMAFAIEAPAGSRVFDHRRGKDEPGYFTAIKTPVADILTEIDQKR